MAPPRPQDLRAGYTGLIVAVLFIFTIVFGMVKLTHRMLSSETPAAGAEH